MSETKHTAGNWKISQYDESPEMIVVDNGKEVETVIAYAYEKDVPKEEREANARLISKAPELLEAFEKLVFIACDRCVPQGELPECSAECHVYRCKQLIAKARGDNE